MKSFFLHNRPDTATSDGAPLGNNSTQPSVRLALGRGILFLSVLSVFSVLNFPVSASAADLAGVALPDQFTSMVVVLWGISGLIFLVNGAFTFWDHVKPHPPLNKQFAARDHDHPEMVKAIVADHRKSIEENRAEHAGITCLIRQLIETIETKNEDRFRRIHERVEGIASPLNILKGRVDEHISHHPGANK
jgi:hypothetical protein